MDETLKEIIRRARDTTTLSPESTVSCPKCDGKGKMIKNKISSVGETTIALEKIEADCDRCEGHGTVAIATLRLS